MTGPKKSGSKMSGQKKSDSKMADSKTLGLKTPGLKTPGPKKRVSRMSLAEKIKLPPETPIYIGDRTALDMNLSVITYDSGSAEMARLSAVDELPQFQKKSKTIWINISGLKDVDSIKNVGDLYDIHLLTIEDILHTEEQPKIEMFENYKFISFKTLQRAKNSSRKQEKKKSVFAFFGRKKEQQEERKEFLIDQVSMIIMKDTVITFQEIPGDSFDNVRRRILSGIGDIRKMGTDYLAYTIIDSVVDEYFLTLNYMEEKIEDFEDRATKTSDDTFIEEIQDTKKNLFQIKRAISPLKIIMAITTRQENFFGAEELKPFLQDLNENLNHAIITAENHREWLTNVMDVNLSVLSHQMNKVMKVLAIISTIFIPLTFISGVYGMNFEFMPELKYDLAYPITLCAMGLVAGIMIIFFKIRRWF